MNLFGAFVVLRHIITGKAFEPERTAGRRNAGVVGEELKFAAYGARRVADIDAKECARSERAGHSGPDFIKLGMDEIECQPPVFFF